MFGQAFSDNDGVHAGFHHGEISDLFGKTVPDSLQIVINDANFQYKVIPLKNQYPRPIYTPDLT